MHGRRPVQLFLMSSKDLGQCAILAALLTLGLWAAGNLPTGRIAAVCVLSLIPGAWLRSGCRGVAVAVLAAVILGFFLCINRALWWNYTAFFAWYALLYVAAEKKNAGRVFRLIAAQFFLAALVCGHLCIGMLHWYWWLIPLAEAGLILWDFFFSFCVSAFDSLHFSLFKR